MATFHTGPTKHSSAYTAPITMGSPDTAVSGTSTAHTQFAPTTTDRSDSRLVSAGAAREPSMPPAAAMPNITPIADALLAADSESTITASTNAWNIRLLPATRSVAMRRNG